MVPGGTVNVQVRHRLFSLPEYQQAQLKFVHEGVGRLMEAKDELWASIPKAPPTEAVPITQNTMPSGRVVQNEPVEMKARFEFKYEEIRSCDTEALAAQMDNAADEALSTVMPRFFEIFRRTCDSAGTAINCAGKPFSFALWLEMLEKVEIDFDEQGNPDLPTLVVGPDLAKQIKASPPSEEQRRALADLIERKRNEYNARRRNRKLR